MKVKLIVEGGAMKANPVVSQQLGPLGINLGKVMGDVNEATSGLKGMNVPVEIDVDPKTKEYKISVSSPGVAELLKKELKLDKGSGEAGKVFVGNMAFERIVEVAKMKQDGLLAKDFKSAVKLVVGSCVSLGIMIDNKEAKDIEKDIDNGDYDKQINEKITEVSSEKKEELANYFNQIKSKQDKEIKAKADAKAAEEEAKNAAAAAAPATATPAAGKDAKASVKATAPVKKK